MWGWFFLSVAGFFLTELYGFVSRFSESASREQYPAAHVLSVCPDHAHARDDRCWHDHAHDHSGVFLANRPARMIGEKVMLVFFVFSEGSGRSSDAEDGERSELDSGRAVSGLDHEKAGDGGRLVGAVGVVRLSGKFRAIFNRQGTMTKQ